MNKGKHWHTAMHANWTKAKTSATHLALPNTKLKTKTKAKTKTKTKTVHYVSKTKRGQYICSTLNQAILSLRC